MKTQKNREKKNDLVGELFWILPCMEKGRRFQRDPLEIHSLSVLGFGSRKPQIQWQFLTFLLAHGISLPKWPWGGCMFPTRSQQTGICFQNHPDRKQFLGELIFNVISPWK